ncbi:glyoxylase-like metal-dependent hydrolase (beta-lactamase superfamily II) [Kushneria sinocarnis]|uniref:Glyoxylase-like metal-dependent hydrolase (Beta-lactamase superfamily II) n=1 Tax=Kushneria sinocarnis TaxID=595502 RepID=A0A420WTX8_9GAMM|nr:MBL fold metallo-hydrolase [Kushneria sinocarnis]RKQ96896.1 glyoxylase-like metal-dependent hydrolase (beta-lactamase superfamily II) [Kushneria sinocarnis]
MTGHSELPRPRQQSTGAHHLAVGEIVVTTLQDALMSGSLGLIQNLDEDTASSLHRRSLRPDPPRITLNAYLLWLTDRLVLVDTGFGVLAGEEGGRMSAALAEIGVLPEAIDDVLITHVHPDHTGGLINHDDQPAFPNATVHIPGGELDFWMGREPEGISEALQQHFAAARRILGAIEARTERLDGDEVMPGITRVRLPGHTPDHSGYRIESNGDSLLIWGDIVHLPHIQLARPEAGVLFDVEGDQARRTRETLLEEVSEQQQLIAGHHLDFPGVGHIVRDGDGYRFLPHVWSPVV